MKTQFEVNEDFRVMENEELVYMLTKKNDFSQKAAEDLFGYPNTSSFSDVISQMTPAKRRVAMAAVELYKRLRENAAEPQKIMCSQDIYKLMYPYLGDIATEECWAVFLNQASRVIKRFRVSCGGYSATQVDIRVILREALLSRAVNIILCHNHPSGNKQPSRDDDRLTQAVATGAKMMNLRFLDHVIIAGNDYYSFADDGKI